MFRPGYKPPSQKDISDTMIEKVHDSLQDESRTKLRNEPIMCASLTIDEGEVYTNDAIDASSNSHTVEYLAGTQIWL